MSEVLNGTNPRGDKRLVDDAMRPIFARQHRTKIKEPPYKQLGWLNGMTRERSREVMARHVKCIGSGHVTGGVSTERGYHATWCCSCEYIFHTDSSD